MIETYEFTFLAVIVPTVKFRKNSKSTNNNNNLFNSLYTASYACEIVFLQLKMKNETNYKKKTFRKTEAEKSYMYV